MTHTNDERVAAVERHLLPVEPLGHHWVVWCYDDKYNLHAFNAPTWGEVVDKAIDFYEQIKTN